MEADPAALPDDIEALKAALLAARADAAAARAERSDAQALIANLKLEIEKLRRSLFGQSSENAEVIEIRGAAGALLELLAEACRFTLDPGARFRHTVVEFLA